MKLLLFRYQEYISFLIDFYSIKFNNHKIKKFITFLII
jgi:hypothetical protein